MRWKATQHGHDPRHIDLIAIIVLLVAIVAGFRLVQGSPANPTAGFVVPSQSVRW